MTFFLTLVLSITQFGSISTDNVPKVNACTSYELCDGPFAVGTPCFMKKTVQVTKEVYQSLQSQPIEGVTLLGKYWVRVVEVWKDIRGYKGCYQISSFGRVKSLGRYVKGCPQQKIRWQKGKIKSLDITREKRAKYFSVYLSKNNLQRSVLVHCLVAKAFIPDPFNLGFVNHINVIKTDNIVINLEWVNYRENCSYRYLGKPKKSKYIGVSRCGKDKKWTASIYVNKRGRVLGRFWTEGEASSAYKSALKRYGLKNKYTG